MTTDTGRWLRPSEAARLLNTSPSNLSRLARTGRLQIRTMRGLGGHWRYLEADVLEVRARLMGDNQDGER